MENWQVYYDEFCVRTDRIPTDAFDRRTLLYEAAHDAYEAATNRLTSSGTDAEEALVIGRALNGVAKKWIDSGATDYNALEAAFRTAVTISGS